jgi:hypothetical protein
VAKAKRESRSGEELPEVTIQLNSWSPFLASVNCFSTFTIAFSHKETYVKGKEISTEGIIAGKVTPN